MHLPRSRTGRRPAPGPRSREVHGCVSSRVTLTQAGQRMRERRGRAPSKRAMASVISASATFSCSVADAARYPSVGSVAPPRAVPNSLDKGEPNFTRGESP